ncbi:MAG: serine hydrolase domain-containing protein [Pseudohongiellaceae bacterium]
MPLLPLRYSIACLGLTALLLVSATQFAAQDEDSNAHSDASSEDSDVTSDSVATNDSAATLDGDATAANNDTAAMNNAATLHPVHRTSSYDPAEYARWLESAITAQGVPGVAVAIVSRDGVIHTQTWGVTSVEEPQQVTTDSVFRIASMSKTFAGAAATLLVNQQLQSWDAPLNDMLPGLRLGNRNTSSGITLKHLASHSTGLMPHSYSNLLDDGVEYEKVKERFHLIPTVCAPGKCYGYQNVVFSLIGDVVESSTGNSYENFLQEQLFKPLGMTTASVGLDAYQSHSNITAPHLKSRGRWRTTSINPAYYTVAPASGINASVNDMSLWLRANLGAFPEVLPSQVLNEMHSPVVSTPYGNYFNNWRGLERAHYGIGWRVLEYRGLQVVHHGGGVRGYRSEMALVPEADIGLVILMNGESTVANDVVPTFLDSLLP